jgi:hypothetical protein
MGLKALTFSFSLWGTRLVPGAFAPAGSPEDT